MTIDPTGIGLAVAAALGWSILDALRKRLAVRVPSTFAILWGLVVGQIPLFAAWAVLAPGHVDWAAYALPGAGTLLINLAANLAFIKALEVGALSRLIPILSLTPAITVGTGVLLLDELPSPMQNAGIVLVVTGSVLLAVSRSGARFRLEPGVLLMAGVATAWSLSAALDKVALQHITVPGHGLIQGVGLLVAVSAVLAARGARQELAALRPTWGLVVAAAAVMTLASSLQYLALQRVFVSLVETIKRALGGVVALGLGVAVFDERAGVREVGALILVTAGTALVLQP